MTSFTYLIRYRLPFQIAPRRFANYTRLLFFSLAVVALLSACAVEFPLISGPKLSLTSLLDHPADPTVDPFVDALATALVERDYPQLQSMMVNPFHLSWWQADMVERPAAVALLTMRDSYLGAGSALAFREVRSLATFGIDVAMPLSEDDTHIVRALYVVGLGATQQDEAILLIARHADGAPYWHSVVFADNGFPTAMATTNAGAAAMAVGEERVTVPQADGASVDQLFSLQLRNVTGNEIAGVSALPQVQFAPDAQSATIRGVIQPIQARTYLLDPLTTSELLFALHSTTTDVTFAIIGLTDGQSYKALEDHATVWQGQLPATQEYLVTVATTAAQPFELAISMADGVAAGMAPAAVAVEHVTAVEQP